MIDRLLDTIPRTAAFHGEHMCRHPSNRSCTIHLYVFNSVYAAYSSLCRSALGTLADACVACLAEQRSEDRRGQ